MVKFPVAVLLNVDDDFHFDPYEPGQKLATDDRTAIVVEAESEEEALDYVWEVGNRVVGDAEGKSWSPDVRSLSVGDVIAFPASGDAYAVQSFGFVDVHLTSADFERIVALDGTLAAR